VPAASIDADSAARVDLVGPSRGAATLTAPAAVSSRLDRGWPQRDLTPWIALAGLWREAEAQLAEDEANLRQAYGPQWPRVPQGYGEVATDARDILGAGIVSFRLEATDPVSLSLELGPFVQFTVETVKYVSEPLPLLGECLGADLTGLTLEALWHVARGVLRLADVPPPNPAWCRPAAARAAAVALAAFGEEMRAAGDVTQQLYDDFTDELWDLEAVQKQRNLDRWWQVGSRRAARAELTAVSRSGRAPTNLRATMETIRRASELREGVDASWASMRGHLGWFADDPIPDADGATRSLSSLLELQTALGNEVNEERLAQLARADAFVTDELKEPADAIVDSISVWTGMARRFDGPDPYAFTIPELEQWAAVTKQSLDVLLALKESISKLRPRIRSVAELFDDVVARDRVDQIRALLGLAPVKEGEER
jgi:hypothetical protein